MYLASEQNKRREKLHTYTFPNMRIFGCFWSLLITRLESSGRVDVANADVFKAI